MSRRKATPLLNTTANSAPRRGEVGVLPADELPHPEHVTALRIVVKCPECSNYAVLEGRGEEFRNVTQMIDPTFCCSQCSWEPATHDTPERWPVYYGGRLGGTLIWAMNEEHLDVLVRYLETPPNRRSGVQFGWEYRRLMARLPNEATSGRYRNDVVSLLKKLLKTKPHGV